MLRCRRKECLGEYVAARSTVWRCLCLGRDETVPRVCLKLTSWFRSRAHRVAKGLASLERRRLGGGDGDALAGVRIATLRPRGAALR